MSGLNHIYWYSTRALIGKICLKWVPKICVRGLQAAPAKDILQGTAAGIVLQGLLGAPFLLHAPGSYLQKAFELSRVFMLKWSVNLQFLPEVRLCPNAESHHLRSYPSDASCFAW